MQPYEVVAGPLTLWLAPVGTAFPIVSAAPGAGWVKVGTNGDANYDEGGVVVSHVQKTDVARPAGRTGPIKAWMAEEDFMISLTLWDLTLEQYATAVNGATVATVAAGVGTPGIKKIGLSQGLNVKTYALLARGVSAYGDNYVAQFEVPICFQSSNAKPNFKKAKPAGLDLEFTALEDMAAVSPDQRFGRLIMQHAAALP